MPSTRPSKKSFRPKFTQQARQSLVVAGQRARQYAYAPYSKYLVGAALFASTGEIYTGCNVENAAYSSTICAERVALVKAVSEGVRSFEAVVVVTDNGGFPFGACRPMVYQLSPFMLYLVVYSYAHFKSDLPLPHL